MSRRADRWRECLRDHRSLLLALATLALLLAGPGASRAGQPGEDPGDTPSSWQAPGAAALSVQLDDDGRPTIPQAGVAAASRAKRNAAPALPAIQPAPGGGDMILLGDAFRSSERAREKAAPDAPR